MTNVSGAAADTRLVEAVAQLEHIHARRPSLALADGKTPKTAETIRKILVAGHDVFVEEGFAGLSLRKVADEASIAVGNLTYHFATKSELIKAILTERLTEYAEEHLAEFQADTDSPKAILLNVVAFYARNATTTHRFFYQMWGYAGSSLEARDFVRSLYLPIGRFIFHLVRAANPALEYGEVRRVVLQIFSLEEGYKLFIGLGPDDDLALQNAESDIRILTERILFDGKESQPGAL